MNSIKTLYIVFFLLIMAGCEKGNTTENIDSNSYLIESIEVTPTTGEQKRKLVYEFKYDTQGKLVECIAELNGNERQHVKWTHTDNSVRLVDVNDYNDSFYIEWTFNSKGLIKEQIQNYVYLKESTSIVYIYDREGWLCSKQIDANYSDGNGGVIHDKSTLKYERSKGNVISYFGASFISTYTEITDNLNLDIMPIIEGLVPMAHPCTAFEMDRSTFKNLGNRNFLRSISQTNDNTVRLEYGFDKNNHLTEVRVYSNEEYCYNVTIGYKKYDRIAGGADIL